MIVFCPECNMAYDVENSMLGEKVKCTKCENKFIIKDTKTCPMCGEEILAVAKKCKFCGEEFDEFGRQLSDKSRSTYILLGLFFGNFGINNFYINDVKGGIAKFIMLIVLIIILGVMGYGGEASFFLPCGILSIVSLIEICSVTDDKKGNKLR